MADSSEERRTQPNDRKFFNIAKQALVDLIVGCIIIQVIFYYINHREEIALTKDPESTGFRFVSALVAIATVHAAGTGSTIYTVCSFLITNLTKIFHTSVGVEGPIEEPQLGQAPASRGPRSISRAKSIAPSAESSVEPIDSPRRASRAVSKPRPKSSKKKKKLSKKKGKSQSPSPSKTRKSSVSINKSPGKKDEGPPPKDDSPSSGPPTKEN